MRWLGLVALDSIRFEPLDGLSNSLLVGLEFLKRSALLDDNLVELIELLFQVGQMRFDFFQALGELFVHIRSWLKVAADPTAVERRVC